MQPDEDNLFRDHLLDHFTTWYFFTLVAMDLLKHYLETDEDTRP